MFQAVCEALNAPYVYTAHEVQPGQLAQAVEGLKALGFCGWNVTIPHKVEILPLLDELDETAREIGAVNTVVVKDGKTIGFNTDGLGYLRSLTEETAVSLPEQRIVLLGAGGAARAVGYTLAKHGAKSIVVAARRKEQAEALARHLSRFTQARACMLHEVEQEIKQASLLINATPIGMMPKIDEMPVPADWLHERLIVSDLVYHPEETKILKEAKLRGAQIHTGIGMLVYQAAIAWELWTGSHAPISLMRETVKQALK
jgi:shikimate dehydrogenase